MTLSKSSPQPSTTNLARNAFRVALFVFITTIVLAGLSTYRYIQSGAGSSNGLPDLIIIMVATIVQGINVWLCRRGQSSLAIMIMLGTIWFVFFNNQLASSGTGLALAVSGIAITILVAAQTMPTRTATPTILIGVGLGVAVVLLDVFGSNTRPPTQSLTSILVIGGLFIAANIFFVIRQFQTYRLRTKFFLLLFPLIFGPLVTVSYLLYQQTQTDIRTQATNQLISLAQIKEVQIHNWTFDRRTDMENLSIIPDMVAAVDTFLAAETSEADKAAAAEFVSERLRFYLSNPQNSNFSALLVARADTGEVVITSPTAQHLLGVSFLDDPLFVRARIGNIIVPPHYDPRIDSDRMVLISEAPIATPEGGTIAILMGIIQDERLRALVRPVPGLGETGRAYVISTDGYEVGVSVTETTVSNFDRPANIAIERSLIDHNDGFDQYTTQAGKGVLSIHNWIEGQGLALIVEQDTAEAFAPLARVGQLFILATVAAVVISTIGVVVVTNNIAGPIQKLTEGAQEVAKGNLNATIVLNQSDEIGQLSRSFNDMTGQLRDMIGSLEQRVAERTRSLTLSFDISRRISGLLDQKELITAVVEEIRSTFDFYHVHVYLFDAQREHLVLAGGTGEAARTMLARHHQISEGRGLVGRAAGTNRAVVVEDTANNPAWLPNPLLPDTKSEAAIPMAIGERVIGVLDVQHNIVNGLTEDEVLLLQSIANQIAVALQSARSYEQTQQQAERETFINSLSRKIQNVNTIEDILHITTHELGQLLNASRATARVVGRNLEGQPSPETLNQS